MARSIFVRMTIGVPFHSANCCLIHMTMPIGGRIVIRLGTLSSVQVRLAQLLSFSDARRRSTFTRGKEAKPMPTSTAITVTSGYTVHLFAFRNTPDTLLVKNNDSARRDKPKRLDVIYDRWWKATTTKKSSRSLKTAPLWLPGRLHGFPVLCRR